MEVLLKLDRSAGQLGSQLECGLRQLIQRGVLAPGALVPSTRELSEQLAISRGLVLQAYDQLTAEGYLVARRGSGTRIAIRGAAPRTTKHKKPDARIANQPSISFDFRPGAADVRLFPVATWQRCLRRQIVRNPMLMDYPHPAGLPFAREALANYLNRTRATDTHADNLIFCTGFVQAIRIMAEVLVSLGMKRVGVENPGHVVRSGVLQDTGVELVPVPLDDDGLRVEVLERSNVDAVIVTPAHHYPTGIALSGKRRSALLAWAAAGKRLIIEDDYDSEYRYDRDPVGALQGLAAERVVYIGTASKVLAPGLRLAWLALPPSLVGAAFRVKRRCDWGSPVLDQLAFGEFIEAGELDKHVRRTRAEYRRRRDKLVQALAHAFPDQKIHGAAAGLHLMMSLPEGRSETDVVRECARQGVRVHGTQLHFTTPSEAPPGLVIGFGRIREDAIAAGVEVLANVVRGSTIFS